MTLAANKKLILLTSAFFLNTVLTFSIVTPSSLMQYGDNIDKERLHLLESRKIIRFLGDFSFFAYSTYIINNIGDEYHATLGVLFSAFMSTPSFHITDIQFLVGGMKVQHIERETFGEFIMGETRLESPGLANAWALIDVLFPESNTVIIQVQYRMRFNTQHARTWVSYNAPFRFDHFANIDAWKGPTQFSLEIINQSKTSNHIEPNWITNIDFFHSTNQRENIRTAEYLFYLQELESDLMQIQRLNENTIRIDFTEEFMNSYRRGFTIDIGVWTLELGGFFSLHGREIGLSFIRGARGNISRRELSPYELIFFTSRQLRVMRNMFFARHGFVFQSEELTNMFNSLGEFVFQPNPNFHERMLTDIDRANISIIQRLEAMVGD